VTALASLTAGLAWPGMAGDVLAEWPVNGPGRTVSGADAGRRAPAGPGYAVRPMIALVKIRLRRPRSVPEKAATIFALYATAGLLAALAPLLRLPGEGGLVLPALLVVVAFVVGQQLVWAGFWSLFTGLLAGGTFVFLTFYGPMRRSWRGTGDRCRRR